jgi:sec-independent protein translocase protein TatA
MFGSIGMPELIIILVIALIIFGPRKLPELGRSLGKSIGEFKRASNELRSTLEEEIRIEEQRERTTTAAPATPAAATPPSPTPPPAAAEEPTPVSRTHGTGA